MHARTHTHACTHTHTHTHTHTIILVFVPDTINLWWLCVWPDANGSVLSCVLTQTEVLSPDFPLIRAWTLTSTQNAIPTGTSCCISCAAEVRWVFGCCCYPLFPHLYPSPTMLHRINCNGVLFWCSDVTECRVCVWVSHCEQEDVCWLDK